MTAVLPNLTGITPILSGRWLDSGSTGQIQVTIPATTLVAQAEWYLAGGTSSGSLSNLNSTDWTGPANKTDGSGNPVKVFTASKITGTVLDRYTRYFFAVGQRDIVAPATFHALSSTSSGTYPTKGWDSGTVIVPSVVKAANSEGVYSLQWNAVSGVDFSKTYVVQRALGKRYFVNFQKSAPGTTEATTNTYCQIDGWYTYAETTDTQTTISIVNDVPTQYTWFRVMAKSDLFGYTGVFEPSASSANWVGVPNNKDMFGVGASTGGVVVGEPTDTSSTTTTEASMSDPVNASDLQVETNLPMLANGIGGINHMRAGSRVRWRDGILVLNADQTVSKSHTTRRWGFRFHYNPSTWSQSSAIAQDIDLTTYSQTGGNLLLPTAFSTVDLTVYLNRIVELSTDVDPADPEGVARRAHQLSSGDFNLGSGDGAPQASINPVGLAGSYFDWNGSTPLALTSGYSTVEDKVSEVLKKGTLADLEYLYRAANGDPVEVTHTSGKTADIGMLAMTIMDLYLGPNIKYTVRVASASIQHMMFSNRMIPTFTQVQLSLIRGITMASTGDFPTASTSTAMAQYVKSSTGSTP